MSPLLPALLATLSAAAALLSLSRSNPERRLVWGRGGRGEKRSFWFWCLLGLMGGFTGLTVGRLMDAGYSALTSWLLSLVGPCSVNAFGMMVHNRTRVRYRARDLR